MVAPGSQQLVFNQRLPILSHVKTLFQTGDLVPIKTRQAPVLPIPLVDQNVKSRGVAHISLDSNVKKFVKTHKIVATSSSLRSLIHVNTSVQVTVIDGVKYIGKRVNRSIARRNRIGNTYLLNYLDSIDREFTPIYSYNSWTISDRQICIRHRSDCLVRNVGTISFKTRGVTQNARSKMSESTRADLWLHSYLRGESTIAYGTLGDGSLTHLEYLKIRDLVDAEGAGVAPFMYRLDAVIEFVDSRVVEDGFYCLKIGEKECTLYRMGEGARKEEGKARFEDMLDQLEF
jgi:hypothetical protein